MRIYTKERKEKMSSTGNGYKKIMWGVLLSAVHAEIPIGMFCVQIIPMFLGFGLVMIGCMELRDQCGLDFMDKAVKSSMTTAGVAFATWIVGMFFSYQLAITQALVVLVYVFAIATYGDILNKTIRLYKLEGMEREADRLRKDRMTFIKIYLAGVAVCLIGMIPQLSFIRQYVTTGVMFAINLWLSLIIQNILKRDVTYHPQADRHIV